MLAMALLLHGGLLGGMGGEAAGVDGSGEGAWTLATPAEGFLAASGTGELAHLLHLCLFRAFPRGASLRSQNRPSDSRLQNRGMHRLSLRWRRSGRSSVLRVVAIACTGHTRYCTTYYYTVVYLLYGKCTGTCTTFSNSGTGSEFQY